MSTVTQISEIDTTTLWIPETEEEFEGLVDRVFVELRDAFKLPRKEKLQRVYKLNSTAKTA